MAELLVIALYVSSVKGHHVTRYGTGTLIGAEVDLEHPGNLRWDEEKIVAIPEAEYFAFKREYDRLIEEGALKKRSVKDYDAAVKATADAIDKAAAEAKAKAEASAKAETKPVATETKPAAPETQHSEPETTPPQAGAHPENHEADAESEGN